MADLFDYSDYRAYLRIVQRRHPVLKRAITTEEWSKRLGYRSPRSVAMVLKGQRYPSADLIDVLARDLKWSAARKRFFELLVLRERYSDESSRIDAISAELDTLNPKVEKKILDEKSFTLISDWYNLVLRQLVESPNFQESTEWICRRLRGKCNEAELRKSIDLMLKNGFLQRDAQGRIRRGSATAIGTTRDIPSVAIRRHHAQMMQRAVEALVEQAPSNREILSLTLSFDAERLDEAKQVIRDFRDHFNKSYSSAKSERVYQLSIQFFEHTAGPLEEK